MRILAIRNGLKENDSFVNYMLCNGHHIEGTSSGITGLNLAITKKFDAAIIDIDLNDICGIILCDILRAHSDLSIILIGAHKNLTECLAGFEAGADDFLIRPLAMSEVLARLEAIVSRRQDCFNQVLKVSGLNFNIGTLEVSRDGLPLKLNPISLKLLEIMMKKSPKLVEREALEKKVWGDNKSASESLRANIYLLRQEIDKKFENPLIHTVYGRGYKVSG